MRPSPRRLLLTLLGLAATLVAVVVLRDRLSEPPPPNHIVPDQFVARMSTEALGRAPDERSWRAASSFFADEGCTVASLRRYARRVYEGDAYRALRLAAPERALTLYAGLLAREPDQVGFDAVTGALGRGDAWDAVLGRILDSPEFTTQLAPAICAAATPAYGPVIAAPPIDLPAGGAGFTGDQAALQAALDATAPGGTVRLAPRAVVRIAAPLRIPRGVTLTTTGDPALSHYASMGRLVRGGRPPDATQSSIVDLGPGATLSHVWVSGGRAWLGQPLAAAVTVRIQGDGATVASVKVADPLGGSGVFVSGPRYGVDCTTATVRGNLVTDFGTEHQGGNWADGISVACPRTTVTGNAVVDPTDVGIVVYRVEGGTQSSVVADNRIIAAGRSAFAALAADPLMSGGGGPFSFRGTSFRDNELWTGARTHVDIGLAAGTRGWFGPASDKGVGASFTGNTTGSLAIRTRNAFAVDGMLGATVRGNTLRALPMERTACPQGPSVSRADGWASGSIQGPAKDQAISGCIPQER